MCCVCVYMCVYVCVHLECSTTCMYSYIHHHTIIHTLAITQLFIHWQITLLFIHESSYRYSLLHVDTGTVSELFSAGRATPCMMSLGSTQGLLLTRDNVGVFLGMCAWCVCVCEREGRVTLWGLCCVPRAPPVCVCVHVVCTLCVHCVCILCTLCHRACCCMVHNKNNNNNNNPTVHPSPTPPPPTPHTQR